MALNVTTAVFAENCNTATASPSLAQWDTEQVLQISGIDLPDSYKVEFSTVYTRNAIPKVGDASGVTIPNVLLQRSAPITAYVVLYGENGGRNREYWITIYITPGQPPETITPDPEQADVIDEAIAALNNGVARTEAAATSAEGSARDAEAAVTHYPKIVDGYWYVWNAETETWVNTEIRAEGRDGYSPEVTITEIEGGHRVTITDEDHPQGQTFDVMDGQGGGTGDYDELTNRPRINGHTLTGNQSAADLGLGTYSKPADGIPKTDLAQDVQQSIRKADTALQTAPVQSVAGKTGAVNLGAGDVGFNSSEEYNEGTVGAELSELNRQISDVEENQIPELKNAISSLQTTVEPTTIEVTEALAYYPLNVPNGSTVVIKSKNGAAYGATWAILFYASDKTTLLQYQEIGADQTEIQIPITVSGIVYARSNVAFAGDVLISVLLGDSLIEKVEVNSDNIASNTTAIAENMKEISDIKSTYIDTIDHVFSNVAQIKAFFETFTANKTGEFHEILTVVHTDSSETALQPHSRWTGILTKDSGGQTITFTASCYFGRIAIMTRDPFGEWKIFIVNGTQVS